MAHLLIYFVQSNICVFVLGLAVYLSSFSHAIMNFGRESTEGWSIGKILLVLLGGLTNYAQLAVQSVD